MKRLLALILVGALASTAAAQQTFYARGSFGNAANDQITGGTDPWNDLTHPLVDQGGNVYAGTVTGLTPSTDYQYKVATQDYSIQAPPGNGKVTANAAGSITFHFFNNTTWTDGWSPNNQRRVGYDDPQLYSWDVMGSFNNWSSPLALSSAGNGLYTGQFPFPAGIYDFKFRKADDWAINYGRDFTNDGNNNQFTVTSNGDLIQFDLDLPNGRFRTSAVDQRGDFNADGNTDAADYVYWRKNNPTNSAQYTNWRSNFGRTTMLGWVAHSSDGSFGNAGNLTLTAQGGGLYTGDASGLTPGQAYEVQVLRSDNSSQWPGGPAKIAADASGNIHLNFRELQGAAWNDGWQPNTFNRLGYTDPQQFGWEIVGSFNGWPGTNNSQFALTDEGNGLYTGSFPFDAGTYDFKFRHLDPVNPWDISIGSDFGNTSGNNSFTVATTGDMWNFELDLPNGRWRAYRPGAGASVAAVPEPASLAILMLGMAFVGLTRRK